MTTAIDQTQAQHDKTTVAEALAVLDRFMVALNAGNEPALLAMLHFPHYRLGGGRMRVWDQPNAYLGDFSPVPARTGTTADGIFARLSPPAPRRCTWTCNSPAIAPTKHSTRFHAVLHERMPVCSGAVVAYRSSFDSPLEQTRFEISVPP